MRCFPCGVAKSGDISLDLRFMAKNRLSKDEHSNAEIEHETGRTGQVGLGMADH
jgi:hypothetical protein